jgi:hypothetical protein
MLGNLLLISNLRLYSEHSNAELANAIVAKSFVTHLEIEFQI